MEDFSPNWGVPGAPCSLLKSPGRPSYRKTRLGWRALGASAALQEDPGGCQRVSWVTAGFSCSENRGGGAGGGAKVQS